jgi:transmembrane sensor
MKDKVYPFSDHSSVEQEALEWLIKLDGDTPPSKQERKRLREWLGRSPVHREELNSLNALWSDNILPELLVPPSDRVVQSDPIVQSDNGFIKGQWQRFCGINRRAAFAMMFIVGFALSLSLWVTEDPLSKSNGLYLTAIGHQKSVTLADGSVVQLNTNSQIEVEFSESYRNIKLLQGEVHFEVAKNSQRPFRVYAGGGRVEAVGTAFTVYLKNQEVDVLVVEGRVAIASLVKQKPIADYKRLPADTGASVDKVDPYANSQTIQLGILKAGQGSIIKAGSHLRFAQNEQRSIVENLAEGDIAQRQSWRQGIIIFNGHTLEQVVEEISRFTTATIEISDPALRTIQIAGRFRVGRTDEMFGALETNFGIEVTHLSYNRVQLSAKP